MTTTPAWLGELCRTTPMLRPACPRRVPAAGVQGASLDVVPTPPSERPRLTSVLVNIQYSDLREKRPPPFVHLELTAGRVVSSTRFSQPVPIGRLTVPEGYAVTRPISLGRRDWTAHPGMLVFGDCFGNHLCYRWSQNGRDHQIDLHAWEPVAQTVRVLRAIVASTPNVIRAASLRLSLPAGWTWARERGGYRNCSNPVVKLWAASYRLPKGFGKHEGALVVPPRQALLGIVAKPVRTSSMLWRRWRVSNAKLHPTVPADGSRYKAQLTFPATPAVGATLWAASRPLSTRMLRVTNRLLASLSVDPRYKCRS